MGRFRGRVVARVGAAFIGCSSLLAVVPLQASTPTSATIYADGSGVATTSWTGPAIGGNPDPLGPPSPACTPYPNTCDRTTVTVAVASPGYTATHVISLTADISDANTSTSYDVAILDGSNTVLAQTIGATGSSSTTAHDVQPGTYVVEVDGDIGADTPGSTYTGSLTASSGMRTPQAVHPSDGGVTGSRETVADPFRLGTEPTISVSPDQTVYEGPIFGASTTQSFVLRSDNGGQTFNALGIPPAYEAGKVTPCPGGGDEDLATDAHNNLYFVDLGGAPVVPAAVTPDHGNTIYPSCVANQIANRPNHFPDRQWLSTDTIHNYEWFIWRDGVVNVPSPTDTTTGSNYGEYIEYAPLADSTSGYKAGPTQLLFTSLCKNGLNEGVACMNDVSIAGNAITDNSPTSPGKGNTYLAMTRSQGVGIAVINPTASPQFVERTAVAGAHATLFPTVAVDNAGNIYETYTDASTYQLKVTMSSDQGQHWTAPVVINGAPAATTVMPWIVAGDSGRVEIVFYGSPDTHAPTINSGPWDVYMLQNLNAADPGGLAFGNWTQAKLTDRPNHIEPICLSGLGCTTNPGPGGDRELGDFFRVALDSSGRAMVSFADGNNQLGNEVTPQGAAPSFSGFIRQATGPSLFASTGTVPAISLPTNSVSVGDHNNPYPFASPTGPLVLNNPALELLGSTTSTDGTNVHVRLAIKNLDLTTADTEPGHHFAVYLTRWWFNNHIYFAAAEDDAGQLRCYAGQVRPVSDGLAIKYAAYPSSLNTASCTNTTGLLGTIDITVPGTNVGSPSPSDVLYSVTSYTFAQTAPTSADVPNAPNYATNLPAIIDSLPAYNVVPESAALPETPWTPLLVVVGVVALTFGLVRPRRRTASTV